MFSPIVGNASCYNSEEFCVYYRLVTNLKENGNFRRRSQSAFRRSQAEPMGCGASRPKDALTPRGITSGDHAPTVPPASKVLQDKEGPQGQDEPVETTSSDLPRDLSVAVPAQAELAVSTVERRITYSDIRQDAAYPTLRQPDVFEG